MFPNSYSGPSGDAPQVFWETSVDTSAGRASLDQGGDDLECAICLDMFCEPLRFPCSHAFCRACLIQAAHRRCPLCRAEWAVDFDARTALVDEPLRNLVRRARPEEYAARLAAASAMAAKVIRLRIGNRHSFVENPKPSKSGYMNRHRWTMFVELVPDSLWPERNTSDFVSSVRFKLSPYYTAWPASDLHSFRVGKDPEVRSPPFEVTRVGWGYFPVTVAITFHNSLNMQLVQVEHELVFDEEGSSSFHAFELPESAVIPDSSLHSSRRVDRRGYTGAAQGSRRLTNAISLTGGQSPSSRAPASGPTPRSARSSSVPLPRFRF